MNYTQALEWMFTRLSIYQIQGLHDYKPGLDRILKFCHYLNNPQNKFSSIHIAGTNGKGSTAHMLASILQEAGYRVGLFTSPHLKDFRERIRCNGIMVSKDFVTDFVNKHYQVMTSCELSFFEMTTSMAFDNFQKEKVDIAIIETGLGGRLDSTNILLPTLSVITNVSRDHTEILGDTLEKIAFEKAGIIKPGIPVVIGTWTTPTKSIFEMVAKKYASPIYFSTLPVEKKLYSLPLKGWYQTDNQQTVLQIVNILKQKFWKIDSISLTEGFRNVIKNTGLRGRWELLSNSPLTICDTAHNEDSIRIISEQLVSQPAKQLRLVLGFVRGKEIEKMLSFFIKNAVYYFCQPNLSRAFPIEELKKLTKNFYKNAYYFNSVHHAFSQAKQDADERDLIFIGGSTFVISEIL